jgi:hypothetical protein
MYTYDGSGYFEFLFYGNLYFLYKSVPQTIVLANFGGTKLKEFSLKELTPEIAKQYLEELKIYNVFS